MGELALKNRIKYHFFRLNLSFHSEAHQKMLVKPFCNVLASFSETIIDL